MYDDDDDVHVLVVDVMLTGLRLPVGQFASVGS